MRWDVNNPESNVTCMNNKNIWKLKLKLEAAEWKIRCILDESVIENMLCIATRCICSYSLWKLCARELIFKDSTTSMTLFKDFHAYFFFFFYQTTKGCFCCNTLLLWFILILTSYALERASGQIRLCFTAGLNIFLLALVL